MEDCIVRRGFRGDKYVATFKFKWNNDSHPGFLVRWLSPGDYLAVTISPDDGKARFYKRQSDGTLTSLVPASGSLNLTTDNWYEAKVVIDDDPADSDLQRLGWDGRLGRQPGRHFDRRDADPTRDCGDKSTLTCP